MPLRDHFRPGSGLTASWDGLHGQWPAMIVLDLMRRMPPGYVAMPRVYPGGPIEVDVAAFDRRPRPASALALAGAPAGGPAPGLAAWLPPEPAAEIEPHFPADAEYSVRVFDRDRGTLVAAVEIVSPGNKDRPASRQAFALKVAGLLRQGVSVALVDVVTSRSASLYQTVLELLGQAGRLAEPWPLYAVACRLAERGGRAVLQTWEHPLALGGPLPTLPLWLTDADALPLELEATYEETCRVLLMD